MSKILRYLPELEGEEQLHVAKLLKPMNEEQAEQFAHIYRQRRRDPAAMLIVALVGFLGFAGIHRFLLDQIAMGLVYVLTAGFCFIGTIIDLFNYKSMTYRYNMLKADEVALLVQNVLPAADAPRQLPPETP